MLLNVDPRAGHAAPAAAPVRENVEALVASHASLPWPERAGRAIGMRLDGARPSVVPGDERL